MTYGTLISYERNSITQNTVAPLFDRQKEVIFLFTGKQEKNKRFNPRETLCFSQTEHLKYMI